MQFIVIAWDTIVEIKNKYIAEEFLKLNCQITPKSLKIYPVTCICACICMKRIEIKHTAILIFLQNKYYTLKENLNDSQNF